MWLSLSLSFFFLVFAKVALLLPLVGGGWARLHVVESGLG